MPHDEPTISHEVPAMPSEESTTQDIPVSDATVETQHTAKQAQDALDYEQTGEHADWLDESTEPELPRRPRHRLLGGGANPTLFALFGVLLIACGFIGGVLVEKGQSSSGAATTGAPGLASRFAALRGAAGANAGGGASFGRGASAGSAASLFSGGAGATVGQVAYVSGHTLYVTNAEGNTVKVKTSVGATVSKTVKASVKDIHPGETVIVTGSAGANGAVSAESIRVSEAGASGGLGALFGGSASLRGTRGNSGNGSGGASSGGGEPALFGK